MPLRVIFNELSETNKDIALLIATSLKVVQEATERPSKPFKQTA